LSLPGPGPRTLPPPNADPGNGNRVPGPTPGEDGTPRPTNDRWAPERKATTHHLDPGLRRTGSPRCGCRNPTWSPGEGHLARRILAACHGLITPRSMTLSYPRAGPDEPSPATALSASCPKELPGRRRARVHDIPVWSCVGQAAPGEGGGATGMLTIQGGREH